ncbi:carcinoembryonic antigen-related cell adhesion molecule 1-like isoform X1 [Brienomyrus brachyistius]|uniref:carcinoembryonic antigen-related cell adhesion molecule 1-like isoform X1 n=2 Tax=Brienomyrus brachyistius TaxID=42636 RepID=UPI0020B339AE|nr:carcinoembryonic antigen-related cell adhesion molecule 1-like isoform X1 [Brienomyrus brachyistius]XP_048880314.1 carcinoembryonic antigen-related cell adhesion molecule 1-like isoform X1 [Brienomyrus brachyistius]
MHKSVVTTCIVMHTEVTSACSFHLALYAVKVTPSKSPVRAGDNITLILSPSTSMKNGFYTLNGFGILMWSEKKQQTAGAFTGRASINTSSGILSLFSMTVADSGLYVIQSFPPIGFSANTTLTVLEPISIVTIRVNSTDQVEFNDSVSLTCSTSGSSPSYHWLNGSSDIIVGERVHLSSDNQTLTISSILTSDRGPFYCFVTNAISNGTSSPLYLNISYGPENLILKINGSDKELFYIGSNLTLSCSAQSSPPALFQWDFHMATFINGPELRLDNVQERQSGNYTCLAHNARTLRYISKTVPIIIRPRASASEHEGLSTGLLLSLLIASVTL